MTQRDITQDKPRDEREDDKSRKLAEEEPKFGHDGARMDTDERPRSESERKPGNTPGENADSHAKAHADSKGVKP
jgi:hypothetical protein